MASAPFNILIALEAVRRPMTVAEVAELFGKSESTIYRMAQRGTIPSFMFSGSRLFDPSTVAM